MPRGSSAMAAAGIATCPSKLTIDEVVALFAQIAKAVGDNRRLFNNPRATGVGDMVLTEACISSPIMPLTPLRPSGTDNRLGLLLTGGGWAAAQSVTGNDGHTPAFTLYNLPPSMLKLLLLEYCEGWSELITHILNDLTEQLTTALAMRRSLREGDRQAVRVSLGELKEIAKQTGITLITPAIPAQ